MPQTDAQDQPVLSMPGMFQPAPGHQADTGWMRSVLFGLGAWAATRLTFLLIGAYSFRLYGQPVPWAAMWIQWDANFYLDIAREGYRPPHVLTGLETGQSNINFFPLLPMMIAGLATLGLPVRLSGLLAANGCLLAAAILLHRLATRRAGASAADWTVLSLMALPGSFAFSGPFSESPFLALSIAAAFFSTLRPRASAFCSALLTISRLTGLLQGMGMAFDWLLARIEGSRQGSYARLLPIAFIPLPLLLFFAFMFHLTGDVLAPLHSQVAFWKQHVEIPFQSLFLFLNTTQPRIEIESLISLILLLVTLSQIRLFSAGEVFFVAAVVLSYTSTEAATPSLIRYTVGLYPVHLAIGRACSRHVAMRMLLLCMAMAGAALAAIWFHGSDSYI